MRLNFVLLIWVGLFMLPACQEKKAKADQKKVIKKVDSAPFVDGIYKVDQAKVKWTGKKLGGLDKHFGLIQMTEGSFVVAQGKITYGGYFTLDAQSIASEDLKDDPESAAKLNGHLKSPDFFDAANYPVITFVINEVVKDSTAYQITGDLNIKDSTQTLNFPASINQRGNTFKIEAAFSFDRTDFDIMFHSGVEKWGDKTISDDIDIELTLSALRVQNEAAKEEAVKEVEIEELK